MRKLLAAVIAGLTLGVLASAAFACNYDVYAPPQNDSPSVQQPQPGNST